MSDMLNMAIRLIGAISGSSIAVVFRSDDKTGILKQIIVGIIIGFVSSPYIGEWLDLNHQINGTLASAALGGLSGYVVLKSFFLIDFPALLKKILEKKIGE